MQNSKMIRHKLAFWLILKNFAIVLSVFAVAFWMLSDRLKPVYPEYSVLVHMNVEFMQDMFNVQLAGKSYEEIEGFIRTRQDSAFDNLRVVTAAELVMPDAKRKFGFFLKRPERHALFLGKAFVTGVSGVQNSEVMTGYGAKQDKHGKGSWRDNDKSARKHFPNCISHLVSYVLKIMEYHPITDFEDTRANVCVIPVASTPYVLFGGKPRLVRPEITTMSLNVGFGGAFLILLLGSLLIIVPIVRRLEKLEGACQKVLEGDYTVRSDDRHMDTIGSLGRHFDKMTAAIERHTRQQKDLLQAVSHEIRTPLSRISFTLAMIEVSKDDPKGEQRIESIGDDLAEIDDMLKELSYFNYVDSGKGADRFEENVVAEMLEMTLKRRSVDLDKFDVSVEGVTDEMTLMADRTQFIRVIGNLLSNASRYAKKTIKVIVRHVTAETGRKMLEIAVEDDGIGIPEDKRDNIFEPFVTVDPSRAKSVGGVGLGLAISHRIMKNHHGTIDVEDSELGGARMVTRWPVLQDSVV